MTTVKVKPLVWEATYWGDGFEGEDDCEWQAIPHALNSDPYEIIWSAPSVFEVEAMFDFRSVKIVADTLEDAKAAAQADYERRILSAITIEPCPVCVPRMENEQ
jgi:hypothetical protein